MLKPKDLANVVNKLQAPVIVSDIMHGDASLTSDVQYGLHEVISDMQPDSALLCVALSAKKIASAYAKASPSMRVLEMECARIIEDYAELWLLNAENKTVDEDDAYEALSRTAEDLEGMAELLELNISFLKEKDKDAASLCNIMSIQARAHALVAEAYFEAIDGIDTGESDIAPIVADNAQKACNIIQFPLQKKA